VGSRSGYPQTVEPNLNCLLKRPDPDKVTGICELVLEARDLERLERFYRRLGLTPLSRESDRVWLAAGEQVRLGIWSPGEKEHGDRGGRHVHFALSVPRGTLRQLREELTREGLEIEGPVEHDGGDLSIYLSDPEGNRLELWDFFRDGDGADHGAAALADDAS
jgi:catechol-2,3-dioxygenase